jgi:hypothetical protein
LRRVPVLDESWGLRERDRLADDMALSFRE